MDGFLHPLISIRRTADRVSCALAALAEDADPNAAADSKRGGSATYFCCALGGQDCTLSLWLTSSPKPLVVVRKIFEQDVLDLAWSPDGYTLLAVSMDGSLACLRLEQAELGAIETHDATRA